MKAKVQAFIQQEGLLKTGDKLLVALSGGSDSVALLSIMLELGYDCRAAHMNFHLRGPESDRDEAFVRELCRQLLVPLHCKSVDTFAYASQHQLSIEMAARELRYAWFEELRSEQGLDAIAVGHHLDDDVETFFLNLLRGSGPKGLAGIPPKNGHVLRPLLCLTRDEILQYLAGRHLSYVSDSTNASTDYLRNRIRLQLLPLLDDLQPSARQSVHRSQALLRAADNDLRACMQTPLHDIKQAGQRLPVGQASESMLYYWLSDYGFASKEIMRIWQQRHAPSGLMYTSATHELLLDRGVWLLRAKPQPATEDVVYHIQPDGSGGPLAWRFEFCEAPFTLEKKTSVAWLDAERLQFPLQLRHPHTGDRFRPFGLHGGKLLSDYLTDLKISRFDKEKIWLLLSGNDIVWVLGRRISQDYAIGPSTRRALHISL